MNKSFLKHQTVIKINYLINNNCSLKKTTYSRWLDIVLVNVSSK